MYTQDLIDEVKELYPDNPMMHELANIGSVLLGRYLDDSSFGDKMSSDEILSATSLEEIQVKARILKRKCDLYRKWRATFNAL
jgi:hypothetical protein